MSEDSIGGERRTNQNASTSSPLRVRLRNEELQKINGFLKAENEGLRNGDSPRSSSSGNLRRVRTLSSRRHWPSSSSSRGLDRWFRSINSGTGEDHCLDEKTNRSSADGQSQSQNRSRSTTSNGKSTSLSLFLSFSPSTGFRMIPIERSSRKPPSPRKKSNRWALSILE